jgi:hypothetical protein
LRGQVSAGGSEGAADGGFLFSRYGADQQKIGDVDAGDEKNRGDGAEQDQSGRTELSQELIVEGNDLNAVAGVFAVGAVVGMLGFVDVEGDGVESGLGGVERDSWAKAGDHAGGVAPALRCVGFRGPDVDLTAAGA